MFSSKIFIIFFEQYALIVSLRVNPDLGLVPKKTATAGS